MTSSTLLTMASVFSSRVPSGAATFKMNSPASTLGKNSVASLGACNMDIMKTTATATTISALWPSPQRKNAAYRSANRSNSLSRHQAAVNCPKRDDLFSVSRAVWSRMRSPWDAAIVTGATVSEAMYEALMAYATASASGTNRNLIVPVKKTIGK